MGGTTPTVVGVQAGQTRPPGVALVNLPLHRCAMPPIGLSLLKSALSAANLRATVYNFNLELLPELGENAEQALEMDRALGDRTARTQLAEWLFSPVDPGRDERYLGLLPDHGFGPEQLARLRQLRSRVDVWIEGWASRVVADGHDVVGLSATLGRTRASVRLAEAIRRLAPQTRVVLGGFAASGDMGRALLEAFPVLDLVCHGEADALVVPIVQALRGEPGASLAELAGISHRVGGRLNTQLDAGSHPDLERTPVPDYDDYYEGVRALREEWDPDLELPHYVPVETARGCWWAERSHCTFCSLNGERIRFRSKSADRVLQELDALHARHGVKRFLVVDNVLDEEYYQTLLPRLAAPERRYLLEWEVRPNLGRAKVAALFRAGVGWVQPGLESLSTPALRAMSKGTTAIDNIQCMKWLAAYEIQCSWNFLYSLPGERLEWYEEVARAVPLLMHLPPPSGPLRINAERFSPYVTRARELAVRLTGPTLFARLAFADVRPELLERLVYDFDYEIDGRPPDLDARIVGLLEPLLSRWRESYDRHGCTLSLIDGPGESLLVWGPLLQPERIARLRGLLHCLLQGCESVIRERTLLERLASGTPPEPAEEPPLIPPAYRELIEELAFTGVSPEDLGADTLEAAFALALESGLVYRESGRILSLPVNRTRHVKSGLFRLQAAYRRFRERA